MVQQQQSDNGQRGPDPTFGTAIPGLPKLVGRRDHRDNQDSLQALGRLFMGYSDDPLELWSMSILTEPELKNIIRVMARRRRRQMRRASVNSAVGLLLAGRLSVDAAGRNQAERVVTGGASGFAGKMVSAFKGMWGRGRRNGYQQGGGGGDDALSTIRGEP